MKILGIDTSSKFLSLALSEGRDIIIEEDHLLDRAHSRLLVPKILELLKKLALSTKDIDTFVVGLGPGSFTGLRIGVSTVKGFGIATLKRCVGVSSIDALAYNVGGDCKSIVPVIDAKRANVYTAFYKRRGGEVKRVSGFQLLGVVELMRKIKEEAVFLGDAIALYGDQIKRLNKKAVFLEERFWYPKASNLIKVGWDKIRKTKKTGLSKLVPIYLYPKDCQVKK